MRALLLMSLLTLLGVGGPASGDPNRAFLSLLVMNQNLADGSTSAVDQSPNALTVTVVGNAQADTDQAPTGMTSSWLFDGVGDRLTLSSSALFGFGTGPFWIETVVRFINTTQVNWYEMRVDAASQARLNFEKGADERLRYFVNGATQIISAGAISLTTWYRVAAGRDVDGNTRMFLDGTQIGSTYVDATDYLDAPVIIGSFISGLVPLQGHMGPLRVYKGVCLQTGNHTPDPLPFPT